MSVQTKLRSGTCKRRSRVGRNAKTEKKNIRTKYPDTCERGLNVANKQGEMQKCGGGGGGGGERGGGGGGGGGRNLVFKFCVFLHYSTRVVTNLVPRVFSFCRHIRKREDPGDEVGL